MSYDSLEMEIPLNHGIHCSKSAHWTNFAYFQTPRKERHGCNAWLKSLNVFGQFKKSSRSSTGPWTAGQGGGPRVAKAPPIKSPSPRQTPPTYPRPSPLPNPSPPSPHPHHPRKGFFYNNLGEEFQRHRVGPRVPEKGQPNKV